MQKQTVLITGASRGIGKSTALLFASSGFRVFLNCRNSVDALKELQCTIQETCHTDCHIVPGDVGDPSCVRDIFQKISQVCEGVDILINNAGIAHIGLLMDMSDEDWDRIIHTNLSSVFYCCRAAIPHMVSRQSGRIINISSMWGTSGASCEAAYSASKAGVDGLTKALAKELAPSGIPVNAVSFGVIDTAMNSQLSEDERLALEEEIPMGRFASPEEAARLIYEIALSPTYLTGQIIRMDGGFL